MISTFKDARKSESQRTVTASHARFTVLQQASFIQTSVPQTRQIADHGVHRLRKSKREPRRRWHRRDLSEGKVEKLAPHSKTICLHEKGKRNIYVYIKLSLFWPSGWSCSSPLNLVFGPHGDLESFLDRSPPKDKQTVARTWWYFWVDCVWNIVNEH